MAPPAIVWRRRPTAAGCAAREVRAVATPDDHSRGDFYRQVGDGPWTPIGSDTSSPVYTAFDDTTGLADGSVVRYRAVLTYAPGKTVESATRSVTVVTEPVTTAVVHYLRPAGDYDDWGLHLWGDAIADGVATTWMRHASATGSTPSGRLPDPLKDDTKRSTSSCTAERRRRPTPRARRDRSFVPLEHPRSGGPGRPTVHFSPPRPALSGSAGGRRVEPDRRRRRPGGVAGAADGPQPGRRCYRVPADTVGMARRSASQCRATAARRRSGRSMVAARCRGRGVGRRSGRGRGLRGPAAGDGIEHRQSSSRYTTAVVVRGRYTLPGSASRRRRGWSGRLVQRLQALGFSSTRPVPTARCCRSRRPTATRWPSWPASPPRRSTRPWSG